MDIIFDIDGTLADLTERRKFIATKPKNYAAFNDPVAVMNDKPIWPVIDLLTSLASEHNIILCSGREEVLRNVTIKWLYDVAKIVVRGDRLDRELPKWYHVDTLYMRPAKDYRKDDIIKEELLAKMRSDGFKPSVVFDDRPSVCRMWRRNGLKVCQLNDVEF